MAEDLSGLSATNVEELRVLQELALPHVEASGGKLALLDINPTLYPSQRSYHLKSTKVQQDPALLESIAMLANDSFQDVLKGIHSAAEETERLQFASEIINGGNNIAIVTNHGELIDVALEEAAFVIELMAINGVEFIKKLRKVIVVSRIISMIGINLRSSESGSVGKLNDPEQKTYITSAAEALELLCNDVYLSYPRTETIEKRVRKAAIKAHNKAMLASLFRTLSQGSVLLGLAASGTKDKLSPQFNSDVIRGEPHKHDKSVSYRMGTLSDRTIDIMTHKSTYVAPTAIWMQSKPPVSELCDMPRKLQTPADAHNIMQLIADRLTSKVPEHTFRYSSEGT